jgi:predicted Zn-dependent peptidase
MPGLLRGVARTAVIAGTATHVSNNVSRRQAQKWSNEDAQAAAPQATSTADDTTAQLQQLAQLKDQGIVTQEEFDAKKKQLLGL